MDILLFFKAVILGLVEALTEFAPVSSTGHMIIVDDLWLKTSEFLTSEVANTFKIVIQLGSILAVVVVFKERFYDLLGLKSKIIKPGEKIGEHLKLTHIVVGLIPAGVLGLLFEDYIDQYLFTTTTVLIGLVLGAVWMIAADLLGKQRVRKQTVDQMTYRQALLIGLVQCLSLWPGFSRSGATISGGVMFGLSHRAAADFTFLMAVPIMAGASVLSLVKKLDQFTMDYLPFFIVGFVSAFLFSMLAIRFFLKLINKIKLIPFAVYRIVLAIVIATVIYL